MLHGGYPRIFHEKIDPTSWHRNYVESYVERDMRTLANIGDLTTFQRFMRLYLVRTSQLLNDSSLSADSGITQSTAKRWHGILEASYITFRLPSFQRGNIRKRLTKMPKFHFYDSGLVCDLPGL